jgi:hypothetical protein
MAKKKKTKGKGLTQINALEQVAGGAPGAVVGRTGATAGRATKGGGAKGGGLKLGGGRLGGGGMMAGLVAGGK